MQKVWKGQKVTEKVFGRVLISSICGIFLCLACLVSATWAWYVVSIENPDNTIEIATVTAAVSVDDGSIAAAEDGTFTLPAGTHTLQITLDNQATNPQVPVYVQMSVDEQAACCFVFENGQNAVTQQITVHSQVVVDFSVHWEQPEVDPVGDAPLEIGQAPDESDSQGENGAQQPTAGENTEPSESTGQTGEETGTLDTPESGNDTQTGEENQTGE